MKMTVFHEQSGAIPILRVSGDLDLATAPKLKEVAMDPGNHGSASLAFDLSELEFLDSTGLAAMLCIRKQVVERGGLIYIVGASDRIRNVFCLARLDNLFDFCDESQLSGDSR